MVPPTSHGIPRVPRYSGYWLASHHFAYRSLTFFGYVSHRIQLWFDLIIQSETPNIFLSLVWPLPLSLATTSGISVDFFSSPYLDVSVQAVPLRILSFSYADTVIWLTVDCSIRISVDHYLLAIPHSFSQLTASFVGSQCQGIRPAPFVAWPLTCSRFVWILQLFNVLLSCSFLP